jgi:DNA ligase-1
MQIHRRTFVAGLAGAVLCPLAAAARNAGAPAVLLANVAADGLDPSGYLVSEKYDGARAVWDGRRLRFRSGREVHAPGWFTQRLPRQQALDGELWLGRRSFDLLSGVVRKSEPVDAEWHDVRYMVFELPGAPGSFAQRYEALGRLVKDGGSPSLQRVQQAPVADKASLRRALDDVVRGGGEGLMLHRADAPYLTGRSDALLKLKPLRDEEAVVVAHVAGKSKYAGMMGALDVKTAAGVRFRLGTGFSDELRRDPPAVGATITYTFRDHTPNGVPRFASYSKAWDGQ